MRKSKFSEPQILDILHEADVGRPVKELTDAYGISVPTYYKWRSKYRASREGSLRELKLENASLRQLVFRQAAEIRFLKAIINDRMFYAEEKKEPVKNGPASEVSYRPANASRASRSTTRLARNGQGMQEVR